MIIGAGKAANTLLNEIFNAKDSPYEGDKSAAKYDPVCIIDSDKSKWGTFLHGVKVIGGNDLIIEKAKELDIEVIILAIPSLSEKERKEIIDIMKKFNLLTDEIINEMKYDCNYDIRKMAKKMGE